MLLNVLGLVGNHANERIQLDDCHAQVDQIHRVSQQSSQGWYKICREIQTVKYACTVCNMSLRVFRLSNDIF